MAVYTQVTAAELQAVLQDFNLDLVDQLTEVSDGIENSTYFFSAIDGNNRAEYVLSILENTPEEQISYSSALTRHLAQSGLPVPAPLSSNRGQQKISLAKKTALIFPKAKGRHPQPCVISQCQAIGEYLAKAHLSSESFEPQLDNTRGLPWFEKAVEALQAFLDDSDKELISEQLQNYQALKSEGESIPIGAIHADLFTDNSLFDNDTLTGVIDFYNACSDWLLLDVAIVVNDWCTDASTGDICLPAYNAFIDSYCRIRPFHPAEKRHWQTILCLTACRFWLSRLMGHFTPELLGGEVKTKDPNAFRKRLLKLSQAVPDLPRANTEN